MIIYTTNNKNLHNQNYWGICVMFMHIVFLKDNFLFYKNVFEKVTC